MLRELADLLKDKESVAGNDSGGMIPEERSTLSETEIDKILHHAWEKCLTETEQADLDTEKALKASQSIRYMKGIATAMRNKSYMRMLRSDYKHSLEDARLCLNLIDESESQLAGTAWDIIAQQF